MRYLLHSVVLLSFSPLVFATPPQTTWRNARVLIENKHEQAIQLRCITGEDAQFIKGGKKKLVTIAEHKYAVLNLIQKHPTHKGKSNNKIKKPSKRKSLLLCKSKGRKNSFHYDINVNTLRDSVKTKGNFHYDSGYQGVLIYKE
jgi:hypothetical protein